MFKQGSIADEVASSMERELMSLQTERSHGFQKVAKATDLLHAAAELFANAGMSEEAENTLGVIRSLEQQLRKP
jgi:hypothetical protein